MWWGFTAVKLQVGGGRSSSKLLFQTSMATSICFSTIQYSSSGHIRNYDRFNRLILLFEAMEAMYESSCSLSFDLFQQTKECRPLREEWGEILLAA